MKVILITLTALICLVGCTSTNISIWTSEDGVQHIKSTGRGIVIKKNDTITVYTGDYTEEEITEILKTHFEIQK